MIRKLETQHPYNEKEWDDESNTTPIQFHYGCCCYFKPPPHFGPYLSIHVITHDRDRDALVSSFLNSNGQNNYLSTNELLNGFK